MYITINQFRVKPRVFNTRPDRSSIIIIKTV